MKLKGKLLAGASALVMASGMIGIAAPAAHAAVTPAGSCHDTITFAKLASPTKGQGLGDQTVPIKVSGVIAKDLLANSTAPNSGGCSGVTRFGDAHIPCGAAPCTHPTLTPLTAALSLSGNASCANGATAMAADATAGNAYPLNGTITWKFAETYTDLITLGVKNFAMKAQVALLGIGVAPHGPDVVDIGGIVLSGVSAGATVSGSDWEDPVAKDLGKARTVTDGATTSASTTITSATAKFVANDVGGSISDSAGNIPAGDTIASVDSLTQAELTTAATGTGSGDTFHLNYEAFNTGYHVDLPDALGCADGTPNNANILQVLSSGGSGAGSTSLLGSAAAGIAFNFGE